MAGGVTAVRGADADALRDLARQKRRRPDPLPAEPRGTPPTFAGRWNADLLGLPREDPCPVQCLGIEGDAMHLIDSTGQYRAVETFTHESIQKLFAATPNWPKWACPRYGRAKKAPDGEPAPPPPIESFKDDGIRDLLFLACARRGLFSARDRLRGRGAWKLPGGQLLYHAGEDLWVSEGGRVRCAETGVLGRHLYPRLAPLPPPWTQTISPADNPARGLIEGLRRWNWERPDVDPVLMLGWLGVAFLGGALDWRPALFLVGDAHTGKSTLQDNLKLLFGEALFHAGTTSAAGIYQDLGHESRPIALDELESSADNRRVASVMEIARAASSGAFGRRGSAGHEPVSFQLRSAFLFSAINPPPLLPQDLSRMAILRLRPLTSETHAEPPEPPDDVVGRMVLGRLMTEWPKFEPTLAAYRAALAAGGHSGRGQDTYGGLLAAAELLLGPEVADELGIPLSEDSAYWRTALAADSLPEVEDAKPNWRGCIDYLLTAQVEPWRNGVRTTVGRLLDDLALREITEETARRDLEMTGLGLIAPGGLAEHGVPVSDGWLLAVPNQSQQVARLLTGTPWAGAGGTGVWKDALRQGPAGVVLTGRSVNRVRINGVQARATLIAMTRLHAAD